MLNKLLAVVFFMSICLVSNAAYYPKTSQNVFNNKIQVFSDDITKADILNQFLATKIYQNTEKIVKFFLYFCQKLFEGLFSKIY